MPQLVPGARLKPILTVDPVKNRLKQYTFTSDRSLTLSISLGFSLRRVVHVSARQWLGAWHCVQWATVTVTVTGYLF